MTSQTSPSASAAVPDPATAGSATPASSALRGIVLMLSAVFVFAGMDATGKHLFALYPVPVVAAARYLGNLLVLTALMAPRHGWALVKTQRTGLVWVRALSLAAATLLMGWALQRMPLPETVAIIFLAPFGVLLLAGPVLGETVGVAGWLAAAAGFAGVLLIVRPGGGLDVLGVAFAFAAAAVSVAYNMLSRVLARTETTMALLFHTALAGTVVFGAMLPWTLPTVLSGPAPLPFDTLLLCGIGAAALLGHALFTSAFRAAPASLLAPVNYMHLVWAGAFGWLAFGHVPEALSLLGIAIIAAAGAGIALKTHLGRGRRPA